MVKAILSPYLYKVNLVVENRLQAGPACKRLGGGSDIFLELTMRLWYIVVVTKREKHEQKKEDRNKLQAERKKAQKTRQDGQIGRKPRLCIL